MSKGLFQRPAFTGFGPSYLGPPNPPDEIKGKRARLRAGVRNRVPRLPGIYGMVDAAGELIYVGKARSLRSRLLSYFRPGSRDEKAGRIIADARRLVWEVAADEFAALLRELELIRRWQPRCNVQGQPRRRGRAYVCVGRRPAPQVFLSARPPRGLLGCFGPVLGISKGREAVRQLNDWFRLRDCPRSQEMVFADQRELFPLPRTPGCIRSDIGTCLAPCAAACTLEEYTHGYQAALAFLRGEARATLEILEREMTAAARSLAFERAGVLRDRLESLRWLSNHLTRVRQASGLTGVYPLRGHDGSERWYLIQEGLVRAVLPASQPEPRPPGSQPEPRPPGSGEMVAAMLEGVYRTRGPNQSRDNQSRARKEAVPMCPGLEEIDGVLLVDAWFRRHRDERVRMWSPGNPCLSPACGLARPSIEGGR
jgi:excinuclease ABC subunit C